MMSWKSLNWFGSLLRLCNGISDQEFGISLQKILKNIVYFPVENFTFTFNPKA